MTAGVRPAIRGAAATEAAAVLAARERALVAAKQLRYSVDFARYYHAWYSERLLSWLGSASSSRVLDCGCGTGVLMPILRQRRRRVAGLDICLENLQAARGEDPSAVVVGDIRDLPLARRSFDQVVCRGVLHRVGDVEGAFRQLFDVLRDRGDLVIAEPIGDSRVLDALRSTALAAGAHPCPGRHLVYPSTRQWLAAARAAGFQTVRWSHLGYIAFPLLGFPEAISLMRHVPCRMAVAKMLLGADRVLARVPVVRRWSWQAVFHFRKPG